jgi:hypothetical protein
MSGKRGDGVLVIKIQPLRIRAEHFVAFDAKNLVRITVPFFERSRVVKGIPCEK